MKSTTQSQFAAFTIEEFIRAFRPDGLGHIRMEDGEGKEVFNVTFEEIVCDLCNCELVQPEDEPFKKVVFVLDGYALCEDCHNTTHGEGEDPSLSFSLNTSLAVEALADYRRRFEGDDFELTCDSDAELIQYGRAERDSLMSQGNRGEAA